MGLQQEGLDRERAFMEKLERMVGLVEAHMMMCIAGYFNGGYCRDGEKDYSGDSEVEQGIERVESW